MAANHLQMNPTKTKLLWAGSKHNITMLGTRVPAMQLVWDTVMASDHVWVLKVTFSSDLTLEKHVSKTCADGFYCLRQLCRIQWSLDEELAASLVQAFVMARIDYCNAIYAGAPKTITDKLQRVFTAAARVVSNTKKFDHGLSTNCTGWMCLRWSPSSSTLWRIVVCTDKHLGTSPITLSQPSKLHCDIDYVLPTDTGVTANFYPPDWSYLLGKNWLAQTYSQGIYRLAKSYSAQPVITLLSCWNSCRPSLIVSCNQLHIRICGHHLFLEWTLIWNQVQCVIKKLL